MRSTGACVSSPPRRSMRSTRTSLSSRRTNSDPLCRTLTGWRRPNKRTRSPLTNLYCKRGLVNDQCKRKEKGKGERDIYLRNQTKKWQCWEQALSDERWVSTRLPSKSPTNGRGPSQAAPQLQTLQLMDPEHQGRIHGHTSPPRTGAPLHDTLSQKVHPLKCAN